MKQEFSAYWDQTGNSLFYFHYQRSSVIVFLILVSAYNCVSNKILRRLSNLDEYTYIFIEREEEFN